MSEAIRQGDIPGVQLRRRLQLTGVSAGTLWRWLTEPGKLSHWLADKAEAEPGETGGLRLEGTNEADEVELGETVRWRPPHLWTLRFRRSDWSVATLLELEIAEADSGVELSVLQKGFEHLPLSAGLTLWEAYRRRWAEALARLERQLASSSATSPWMSRGVYTR